MDLPPPKLSIVENLNVDSQVVNTNNPDDEEIILRIDGGVKQQVLAKALWGPIRARRIPSTKRTLAKIISNNINDLSQAEYLQFRRLLEYLATNPESRARVFELTGFEQKDLDFAERFFRTYDGKFTFAKLVEIGLATSSDGRVSRQIGGLVQFSYEIDEVDGQKTPTELRRKILRGIPKLAGEAWLRLQTECETAEACQDSALLANFDLNANNAIDEEDFQTAAYSLSIFAAAEHPPQTSK